MTDLRALHDAFAELERRADAVPVAMADENSTVIPLRRRPRRRAPRLLPAAVAAATVLGLTATAVLLTTGGRDGTPANTPPASERTAAGPTERPTSAGELPATIDDLADRFGLVLDGAATFEVADSGYAQQLRLPSTAPVADDDGPADVPLAPADEPYGPAIVGTLTADGVTGGFYLSSFPRREGRDPRTPNCPIEPEPANPSDNCTERTLPDGSTLVIQRMTLNVPGGMTYSVDLTRPNGDRLDLKTSTARDPKGSSDVLADQPPMTVEAMIEILIAEAWLA